ncbi:isochorismatase family protein [Rhizobium sp. F40D2]|uniref:cysteine hydrolase family protein n=1 Tax=Rhizobium sp. F40D2 TaxID=3453141 RepID=UPI003F213A08
MSKRAIIAIDLQKDYLPSGRHALVGIEQATANAVKVLDAARASGDRVIHVRHEGKADAPFFAKGTTGVDFIPAVEPKSGETVITKHYPNSFRETDLKRQLDAEGIQEVVLVGAMSHMCIDATSRASVDYGYDTIIVHDACATRDLSFDGQLISAAQVHAAYMGALAAGYGKVLAVSELLSA